MLSKSVNDAAPRVVDTLRHVVGLGRRRHRGGLSQDGRGEEQVGHQSIVSASCRRAGPAPSLVEGPARRGRWRRRRFCRVGLVEMDGFRSLADPEVDHLHEHRESHREVDVALRNVLLEAFEDERHADQQQEAEREHLHGRVLLHERADRLGRGHHDADRDHHGGDHHPQLVDHADGGDDGVEREHDVEQHDLDEHADERRPRPWPRRALLPLRACRESRRCSSPIRNRPPTIRIRSRPEIS